MDNIANSKMGSVPEVGYRVARTHCYHTATKVVVINHRCSLKRLARLLESVNESVMNTYQCCPQFLRSSRYNQTTTKLLLRSSDRRSQPERDEPPQESGYRQATRGYRPLRARIVLPEYPNPYYPVSQHVDIIPCKGMHLVRASLQTPCSLCIIGAKLRKHDEYLQVQPLCRMRDRGILIFHPSRGG